MKTILNGTKLTLEQKKASVKKFLENNEYFGLNEEFIGLSETFNKVLEESENELTLIAGLVQSILIIQKEIEIIQKKQIEKKYEKHESKKIAFVTIGFEKNKDLTIGEFLKELAERYSEAGLLDVSLNDIETYDSAIAAGVKLLQEPKKMSFGYEETTYCDVKQKLSSFSPEDLSNFLKKPEKEKINDIENVEFSKTLEEDAELNQLLCLPKEVLETLFSMLSAKV